MPDGPSFDNRTVSAIFRDPSHLAVEPPLRDTGGYAYQPIETREPRITSRSTKVRPTSHDPPVTIERTPRYCIK